MLVARFLNLPGQTSMNSLLESVETRSGEPSMLQSTVFSTELGWISVVTSPFALWRVAFGHKSAAAARRALGQAGGYPGASSEEPMAHGELDLEDLVQRLTEFAAGERTDLSDIPVTLADLTPFSQRIIKECRRLCWGDTCSYGELARRAGRPGAARAVGSVMAKNRLPLVVPCHRVLGASGRLGGYSAPGGLKTKRMLLAAEERSS